MRSHPVGHHPNVLNLYNHIVRTFNTSVRYDLIDIIIFLINQFQVLEHHRQTARQKYADPLIECFLVCGGDLVSGIRRFGFDPGLKIEEICISCLLVELL